jgi:hypothetical protein
MEALNAYGVALAMSTGVLDGTDEKTHAYLRSVDVTRNSTTEEVKDFEQCFQQLWTKFEILPGTPPRIDKTYAPGSKSPAEISAAWNRIFEYRRKEQEDDTAPIKDSAARSRLHCLWFADFQQSIMTAEQRKKKTRFQTSAFNAYLKNNFGGKNFIMAVWQTGLSWAPPRKMLDDDYPGAIEHVGKHFGNWTRRLAAAIVRHKNSEHTVAARKRSGTAPGKPGPRKAKRRAKEKTMVLRARRHSQES